MVWLYCPLDMNLGEPGRCFVEWLVWNSNNLLRMMEMEILVSQHNTEQKGHKEKGFDCEAFFSKTISYARRGSGRAYTVFGNTPQAVPV